MSETDFNKRSSHMRVLLGLAASAVIASVAPAKAQSFGPSNFGAPSGTRWVTSPPQADPGRRDGHRRGHVHRGGPAGAFAYGYGGYNDYGDFDGNRSFDPDKWNDWWHDRPDRAFPRWVWSNQNCAADRMWSSGSGWRCIP
jgi:hypothetical protein